MGNGSLRSELRRTDSHYVGGSSPWLPCTTLNIIRTISPYIALFIVLLFVLISPNEALPYTIMNKGRRQDVGNNDGIQAGSFADSSLLLPATTTASAAGVVECTLPTFAGRYYAMTGTGVCVAGARLNAGALCRVFCAHGYNSTAGTPATSTYTCSSAGILSAAPTILPKCVPGIHCGPLLMWAPR